MSLSQRANDGNLGNQPAQIFDGFVSADQQFIVRRGSFHDDCTQIAAYETGKAYFGAAKYS